MRTFTIKLRLTNHKAANRNERVMLEEIWRTQSVVEERILEHAPFSDPVLSVEQVPDESALRHLAFIGRVADREEGLGLALTRFWELPMDQAARLDVLKAVIDNEISTQSFVQYATARDSGWKYPSGETGSGAYREQLVDALCPKLPVTGVRVTRRSGRLELEVDERRGDKTVTWHWSGLEASPRLSAALVARLSALLPPEPDRGSQPGREDDFSPER